MTVWILAAFVALAATFTISILASFELARTLRRVDENLWRRLGSPTVTRHGGDGGISLVPASPLLRWAFTAERAHVPHGVRRHFLVTRILVVADFAFAAALVVAVLSSLLL
jgi:hypothetical protein